MKLTHLENLLVDEVFWLFECKEMKFPFKLKKLRFSGHKQKLLIQRFLQNIKLAKHNENLVELMKFLRQQKKSLVNLQLPKCLPTIFIHEIFTTFENLKWLHLDPLSLQNDANFFLHLKPLKNVLFMTLDCGFGNHDVAKAFHALFPKLKSLELKSSAYGKNYYVFLMEFHPNLEHLNFPRLTFERDTCDFYLFRKLKSLEFTEVCDFGLELILRHQTLDKVSFQTECKPL